MTKEQEAKLIKAKKEHPEAGRVILSKMTGLSFNQVRDWLVKQGKAKLIATPVTVKAKTLSEFRNTYDKSTIVPAKVKTAIHALGSKGWEYEVQFAKMAGVSIPDLAMFREQFADFVVVLKDNKKAWAGSVSTAKEMRAMI
jgi:hypothetical protein